MKSKERVLVACLAAASAISGAAGLAFAVSGGGEYSVENSVLDNGGGGWLNGGEYASRSAIGQTATPLEPEKGGSYTNRSGFYGVPYLTYQKGLPSQLTLFTGAVSVSLPSNAVTDRETFDIAINRDDGVMRSEFIVDMSKVREANRKKLAEDGAWAQMSETDLTEMYIFDENSMIRDPLIKTGVLTLRYRDGDNDGVIDGTDPEVRVDTLEAWALDEKTRLWLQLPGLGIDKENKTITANFRGPGVYNMIGAMAFDVKNVKSYPVPFRPNGPQAGPGAGQTGTEADGIVFANVPQTGSISIFTLDGQLVTKIDIASNLEVGTVGWQVRWKVKNSSGSKVASGVYIWRVVAGSNSKTGKLMIIW